MRPGPLDQLPCDLIVQILRFFYVTDGPHRNSVSHAHALGVLRQISRRFKVLIDTATHDGSNSAGPSFCLTGARALRFATVASVRHGAVTRFVAPHRVTRTHARDRGHTPTAAHPLPLHLDFARLRLDFVDPLQVPRVPVRSISLLESFQTWRSIQEKDASWCAQRTIKSLTRLTATESRALVGVAGYDPELTPRAARCNPDHDPSLPYLPVHVNLIGCRLTDINFNTLKYVHTIILIHSTGVTPHQVSQLTCVRVLSLAADGLPDLECVRTLVHLRFLFFRDNRAITCVEPLHELENLCYVDGTGTRVPERAWIALQRVPRRHPLYVLPVLLCTL